MCETPKRGCARLICVMMMPAYGRGSMCKTVSAPDAVTDSLAGDFGAGRSVAGISLWRVRRAIVSACIMTPLTLHLCEAG